MTIDFDKALGVHLNTVDFRIQRAKVIAGNLANVDTPNYKARDISFEQAMDSIASRARMNHIQRRDVSQHYTLQYREPMQPSQDGNTVELGVEQAKFAENAMAFETSMTFLNMKLNGLREAIKGQ
ncbi:flagellar basal body rod protein FlgB [Grimontia hollisae]|uniref:Flagellar basal body rod protein FlgB n=2 Tax=Grimontia hollisae TaxID=673 RepID=D0I443_GRIHO|nr:flagellar basal body rod protein FlgB [Grimontia hollisae]AMG30488.1 flagellar basal body rod protein FlgB [Grimontia hollisae]EEY73821.1 flagellar basal-body rod protein FlgB [Grimontia hollisae CIP 101886]MDF2183785.1 flagellar basal body rod protein FlgB [Grimontia hollisae]STO41913.1 Putative proximal rod protein [Grimontia hollisae]STO55837.1 Putative proximal rod protein [Grimontia hollisae]